VTQCSGQLGCLTKFSIAELLSLILARNVKKYLQNPTRGTYIMSSNLVVMSQKRGVDHKALKGYQSCIVCNLSVPLAFCKFICFYYCHQFCYSMFLCSERNTVSAIGTSFNNKIPAFERVAEKILKIFAILLWTFQILQKLVRARKLIKMADPRASINQITWQVTARSKVKSLLLHIVKSEEKIVIIILNHLSGGAKGTFDVPKFELGDWRSGYKISKKMN